MVKPVRTTQATRTKYQSCGPLGERPGMGPIGDAHGYVHASCSLNVGNEGNKFVWLSKE